MRLLERLKVLCLDSVPHVDVLALLGACGKDRLQTLSLNNVCGESQAGFSFSTVQTLNPNVCGESQAGDMCIRV